MNDGVVELRLKKVTRKNEGVYTCVAENSLKKVTSSCCVKVEGKYERLSRAAATWRNCSIV